MWDFFDFLRQREEEDNTRFKDRKGEFLTGEEEDKAREQLREFGIESGGEAFQQLQSGIRPLEYSIPDDYGKDGDYSKIATEGADIQKGSEKLFQEEGIRSVPGEGISTASAIGAGLKAASQLMDDGGGQQVIQGKMPSMPRMPSASRAGYNPTPEPIQYGVPLEVLTNMQLRQQAEGYLRDLYRQARQSIRQPNVISLI
jgi:hypothetical protein